MVRGAWCETRGRGHAKSVKQDGHEGTLEIEKITRCAAKLHAYTSGRGK